MPNIPSLNKGHRIQVSYKGVGRIRVRVRGLDSAGVKRIRSAFDEFYAANNLLALRAVKDGQLSPQQALELLRTAGANATVKAGMFEPLKLALHQWLETHPVADATRKSYLDHLKQFEKTINQTHTVSDLPAVLRTFKSKYQKRGAYRVFNVTRSVCCAFAKAKFGGHSQLYIETFAVQPIPRPKTKKKNETVGLEVADIVLLTSLMEPRHAEHVWSMCLTGMRRNEFFGIHCPEWQWADNVRAIRVEGGKTKNANRILFRMNGVAKPTLGPLAIERAVRKARSHPLARGLPPIHLHAFRYTFRHWCEQANILHNHISLYCGWPDASMMARYGRIEVLPYLEDDCSLLTIYVEGKKWELASAMGSPEAIRERRDRLRTEPVFYKRHLALKQSTWPRPPFKPYWEEAAQSSKNPEGPEN